MRGLCTHQYLTKYVNLRAKLLDAFIPSAHTTPVQPAAQLQVSGAEQVPPFSQAVIQIAVSHHKVYSSSHDIHSRSQFGGEPL